MAAPIVSDFNDFPGNQRLLNSNYGTGWPEGFTAGEQIKWGEDAADGTTDGTSVILTTTGDLVAPGSTGYNITQTGTGRSVTGNSSSVRRQNRATGGMTGDIWMSWLMAPSADGRLGLNLNGSVKGFNGQDNVRIIAVGSSFNVYGPGTNAKTGVFTANETVLMLGLLQMDNTGTEDRLRLWVNPDLSLGESDVLENQTPIHDLVLDNAIMGSSLNTIGIIAYSATSNPGTLDSLRLSNGAYGFSDVTGVVLDNGVPPTIVPPTVPADDATGVLVATAIRAVFNEQIALENGGTITIDDLSGGPDTVITLPDLRVTVSGADLVIEPDAPLGSGKSYSIKISNDAVKDLAEVPNFFAGIADDTTWNFQTVADGTPPNMLFPTSPADNATEVDLGANLVVNFNETIAAGTGNITIRNLTSDSDIVIPINDPRISISGSTLTIELTTSLANSNDYAILIDAGAVTDVTGNLFAGILDETIWNFTTVADAVNPTIVSLSPEHESVAPATSALVATFSETISTPVLLREDFEDGNGSFTVMTTEGSDWEYGTPDSFSYGGTVDRGNGASSGEGACWGTNLGSYAGGAGDEGYYDSVSTGGTTSRLRSAPIDLRSASGASLSFAQAFDLSPDDIAVVNLIDDTTDTVVAEAIYAVTPGNSGWAAVPAIDLADGLGQIVRVEWCLIGTGGGTDDYLGWYIDDLEVSQSGAGQVVLRNLSQGTETVYPIDDPAVTVSGNTLTLVPGAPMEIGDLYAVQISAGAVTDSVGNPFTGIVDDESWSFTAAASLIPAFDSIARPSTVANIDPSHTGNLGVGPLLADDYFRSYLTFDLSEETAATGEVILRFAGSGFGIGENENNTSSLPQTFTLFAVSSDWAGAGQPFPTGTPLATIAFTPQTGNDNQTLSFSSAALTSAFNSAIGGDLYLGLASDAEGPANRCFKWLGSMEDVGFEPLLIYLPDNEGGGGSFADWIASYGGLGVQTGVNDDPDRDGKDNGVENFFGTHPGEFSAGITVEGVGTGTFTFSHPQGTLANDLTAAYTWSKDLVTFFPEGAGAGTTVSFSAQPDTPAAGFTTVTATVTGTSVQKLFVRVEVTQN
ncbi:MAG: Ig-like domain-containing protein [Luteolibacter sp.]